MPSEIGAHNGADRHEREPAAADVLERAGDEPGADALSFKGGVDVGMDERQASGLAW
jgi:hypothetical protein